MEALQAFLLGMMAAWIPSMVLLAWMLRRDLTSQEEREEMQR